MGRGSQNHRLHRASNASLCLQLTPGQSGAETLLRTYVNAPLVAALIGAAVAANALAFNRNFFLADAVSDALSDTDMANVDGVRVARALWSIKAPKQPSGDGTALNITCELGSSVEEAEACIAEGSSFQVAPSADTAQLSAMVQAAAARPGAVQTTFSLDFQAVRHLHSICLSLFCALDS